MQRHMNIFVFIKKSEDNIIVKFEMVSYYWMKIEGM